MGAEAAFEGAEAVGGGEWAQCGCEAATIFYNLV
jgi:hypothetical protein